MQRILLFCSIPLITILLLLLPQTDAATDNAPTPFLLKEINAVTADAFPSDFVALDGVAYFAATTAAHGPELWRSDGTATGTYLLKETVPGERGGRPADLTLLDGIMLFSADDPQNGRQLWRSDGTPDGTFMLKQLAADGAGVPSGFTALDGILYFTARQPQFGYELWRTNGTADGTWLLHDTQPGELSGFPTGLTAFNERLYFAITHDGEQRLFSTEGSANGLIDEAVRTSDVPELTVYNDSLYFRGDGEATGSELWTLDQAGSRLVKDIFLGATGSAPNQLTVAAGLLFFSANDGDGSELWATDGSSAGTRKLDIGDDFASSPQSLTAFSGRLYFSAADEMDGSGEPDTELWTSDGSVSGTFQLAELHPGGSSRIEIIYTSADYFLFVADDGTDFGLYKSGGTEDVTVELSVDTALLPAANYPLIPFNDELLLSLSTPEFGNELFFTSGNAVALVRDINTASFSSYPQQLTKLGETIFFVANSNNFRELWMTDGTTNGTRRVFDPVGSSGVLQLGRHQEHIYFITLSDTGSATLWLRQAEADAAFPIYEFSDGSSPTEFASTDNLLFFVTSLDELWATDGTRAGTYRIRQWDDRVNWLTADGSAVFMSAQDAANGGRELWFSDGTSDGTRLVKDIRPGSDGSNPTFLTKIDDVLYFSADNGSNGRELWRSDGTADGTYLLKDINTTSRAGNSFPQYMTSFDGFVYFSADDGVHGRELWVTDGTPDGTQLFNDLNATGSADPTWATVYGDELFFVIKSSSEQQEIWRTDGDPNNVSQVTNISSTGVANPQHLTVAGGWLYFAATDDALDTELYRTDGTTTQQVGDINPNGSSNPAWLTELSGKLIFHAQATADDYELFYILLNDLAERIYIPMLVR